MADPWQEVFCVSCNKTRYQSLRRAKMNERRPKQWTCLSCLRNQSLDVSLYSSSRSLIPKKRKSISTKRASLKQCQSAQLNSQALRDSETSKYLDILMKQSEFFFGIKGKHPDVAYVQRQELNSLSSDEQLSSGCYTAFLFLITRDRSEYFAFTFDMFVIAARAYTNLIASTKPMSVVKKQKHDLQPFDFESFVNDYVPYIFESRWLDERFPEVKTFFLPGIISCSSNKLAVDEADHFILIAFNVHNQSVVIYDSAAINPNYIKRFIKEFGRMFKTKFSEPRFFFAKPVQDDTINCGVWCCQLALDLVEGRSVDPKRGPPKFDSVRRLILREIIENIEF